MCSGSATPVDDSKEPHLFTDSVTDLKALCNPMILLGLHGLHNFTVSQALRISPIFQRQVVSCEFFRRELHSFTARIAGLLG